MHQPVIKFGGMHIPHDFRHGIRDNNIRSRLVRKPHQTACQSVLDITNHHRSRPRQTPHENHQLVGSEVSFTCGPA